MDTINKQANHAVNVETVAIFEVIGVAMPDGQGFQVIGKFTEDAKAREFAQFIDKAGTFSKVRVRESREVVAAKPREDLGEMLLECRPSLARRVVVTAFLGALGLAIIALGVFQFFRAPRPGFDMPPWIPYLMIACGVVFLMGVGNILTAAFRCHRRGIARRTLFGTRRLLYEEIAEVVPGATRLLFLGVMPVPFTTTLRLRFVPHAGSGLRAIRFASDGMSDPEPGALCGEILKIVARNTPRS